MAATPAKMPVEKVATPAMTFAQRAAIATAPAWRPEPNDYIKGTVIGAMTGIGQVFSGVKQDDYPIIVLELDPPMAELYGSQYIKFHAFHGIPIDILTSIRPKRGDVLEMQYLGEKVTNETKDKAEKDQTTYHLYYIERAGDNTDLSEGFNFGS